MGQLSDDELTKKIEEEMEKTPAYSVQLVIYKEDLDGENWNAQFRDNLGRWQSWDYTEDGWNSVPTAVVSALAELLEALKDKRLVQGYLTASAEPRRKDP